MCSKCNSYTANFKLQAIAFTESKNENIVVRRFSVNKKLVRGRRKKQNDLSEMPKDKKPERGLRPMYPESEERLGTWIEESRSQGLIITCSAIRIRTPKLIKITGVS